MDPTIEGLMNYYLENYEKALPFLGSSLPFTISLPCSFACPLNHYSWVCLDPLYFYCSSSYPFS